MAHNISALVFIFLYLLLGLAWIRNFELRPVNFRNILHICTTQFKSIQDSSYSRCPEAINNLQIWRLLPGPGLCCPQWPNSLQKHCCWKEHVSCLSDIKHYKKKQFLFSEKLYKKGGYQWQTMPSPLALVTHCWRQPWPHWPGHTDLSAGAALVLSWLLTQ